MIEPYNEKGVLPVFRWAYILPQATSHHLHNNSQANWTIFGCEADQLTLLPPVFIQKNIQSNVHEGWSSKKEI